jgi:hypothetical protein
MIRMAREAGAAYDEGLTYFEESDLHRFATLVAAALRDEMWESAMKLVAEAVAAEREACAKVCETLEPVCYDTAGYTDCAAAIRARGQS